MKNAFLLVIASFLISACASSTKVSQPLSTKAEATPTHYASIEINNQGTEAPEHFIVAVKSYLKQNLVNNSLYKEDEKYGVSINVIAYRMRSGFSRAMFGMFAGKDGIDSEVAVVDLTTNEVIGKSKVSSYNITAIGGMEDIAKMHATEIANFLSNEKK